MGSFLSWIRSFDDYGEPIDINYKGDTTYKTYTGAVFTLALKGFMIAFTIINLISLFTYSNPQIIQVRTVTL